MIDKSSPIPVYFQLKNDLIKKISNGVWKPGECITSERELCELYSVSRMTIRQAIGELVQEGILIRVKGKGTYVCEPKVKQQDMMSFTEIIKQTGRELKTEIIGFETIDTPDEYQDILMFDKVYRIIRRRIVDNECVAVETVFIPVDYCGYINLEMLKGSLYKVLEEFGYFVSYSQSSVVAVLVNDEIRDNFNSEESFPVLKIISKTFTNKNKLIFVEESLYRSDKFMLQVNISRREGEVI